ncbi:MAG: cyclase family protein [Caldilineales bacterium]|nr:cyclase family protein [Caldilineales bacterium]
MTIIDITRTLNPAIAVWPNTRPFEIETVGSLAQGDIVNITELSLNAHTGTHVDAPYHFEDDGIKLDTVPLEPYWGLAQVVTVTKTSGPLYPADFAHAELGLAPRLLVHSPISQMDPTRFHNDFVHPSPELADHLGQLGIILYGADAPSMDSVDSKTLPGHHAMQRNCILILEGLDLSKAPDGLYEFVAMPLKIGGGDGSPVRAALRTL